MVWGKLVSVFDYFSIDLLVRTWFAPFRPIGGIVRSFMIIFGIVALAVTAAAGLVFIIAWALVPVLPLLGAGLAIVGWLPW